MTYSKEEARIKIQKLIEGFHVLEKRGKLVVAVMSTVGG